ncbi:transcriptional regulator SdiA [Pantoea sp. A4]|uniref:transcriptional regulator SdiA n=1 Tax=Pantoea sp. A4 TaxID=1225184 RepID=UPI0003643763|nr:transcriptional regulator SdiA [Pantoea sp. A4]
MTIDTFFLWRREVHKTFHEITASADLEAALQQQTEALGFENYAFLIQHPVPFTRQRLFLFSTYPQAWIKRYEEENYFQSDPVLQVCQRTGIGVAWSAELFRESGNLWQEANQFGLQSGFSCSAMAANRALGILSMSSAQLIKTSELQHELEAQLHYLADLSLSVLERFSDSAMLVLNNDFSQRELEVLKWTAEGKTAVEISLILAISEHTVNFHQKNMQKRFNVSNKTQIACYAAATGLI